MKIYNTLTGKKEEFVPIEDGKVKMYACGITVSGDAHIGHAFQALVYDIMRKYLEKKGYDVLYARNYTDVDDKIIAKAHETGISADLYAKQMIEKTDAVMKRLDVGEPTIWLKATENIDNIIMMIERLVEKGHAYPTEKGDVYFAVDSFGAYGSLSNRNLEDEINGVRIDIDDQKHSALDFALWKSAKPGEISWPSPWGEGRPGWHIECSAMNYKAFGEQIDIHGGGRDLIFPHHENEIAQTEALTGKQFARFWTHNGLIKVNGQKMSKSLGNSLLLEDLLGSYSNEAVKFALLQTNYRTDINITDTVFDEAEKHLYGFYKTIKDADIEDTDGKNERIESEFDSCMDDDFNTALAIGNLFGYFREIRAKQNSGDQSAAADIAQIRRTYSLLGLFRKEPGDFVDYYESRQKNTSEIPQEVIQIAEERWAARAAKEWAKSDELRTKLDDLGYTVKDSKDGYELIQN